ncbi:MAG: M23 family metallopeptidase [Pseudomonadota bacterium]
MKTLSTLIAGIVLGAILVIYMLHRIPLDADNRLPSISSIPPVPPPATSTVDLQQPVVPELAAAASATPASATPSDAGVPPGQLLMPVAGIAIDQLSDTFGQPRGSERRHEALDIMAPKGTPVLAVADGKLVKLYTSKPGGLTLYQFDPTEKVAYYYAHLDHYATGLDEGRQLKRGDVIGYVGSTGNADPAAPHLHFAVFELGPEKHWWEGTAVNPYPLLTGKK